jgi:uncharacterized membrane-anchored protein
MEENNNENKEPQRFSESSGMGVISTLIFMIVSAVAMYLLAKYLG